MSLTPDFRARVLGRQWLTGTFLNLGSSITVEIAGRAGFDWVLVDHEHGFAGEDTLVHQLQALSAATAVPIVRIRVNEASLFKRALDLGARGVMVPYVSTPEEAAAAARAVHYPPHGVRGVARFHRGSDYGVSFDAYYRAAHDAIVLMTQIETREGVENAEAIASVDGVDVLFVGPTDLTYNLGIPDQFDHPDFLEAARRVAQAAQRAGKAAGVLVHQPPLVERMRDLGFTVVALGSDGGAVAAGLRQFAAALKAYGR
ncbi:MAG TPA: aldolase/citrate lyase family protein [Opitutaceae bacterium]|jgi:4-hydroxy-2-oxoheptanedioate aldolase|nr:aldolase/citrate lyase family protein [Opitutaceae bacterium]